jgi:DNA invertase Pin-like site-specific DNA recombinase
VLRTRYPREAPRRERRKREAGLQRWERWAAMVEGGMTRAEVARAEGVSRAAVTMGLKKLIRSSRDSSS